MADWREWQWVVTLWVAGLAVAGIAGAVVRLYRWSKRKAARSGRSDPWVLRHALAVLLAGGVVAITGFALTYWATEGEDKDRFDAAIKAATAVAAVAAGVLTWGRLELSRHEHRLGVDRDLTERYSRSIDQLGSADELVRVGAVFALERFALDAVRTDSTSDLDWRMALHTLAALARKDSAAARKDTASADDGGDDDVPVAPMTVVEAVRVLGRFEQRAGLLPRVGREPVAPDLAGVIAAGTNLREANLTGADLTDAALTGAALAGANLAGARFTYADLLGALLVKAKLRGANLYGANLSGALLGGADLTRADLTGANLFDANLAARDTGPDLPGANLSDAQLYRANLSEADLQRVDLTGARLNEADLSRANLAGANLHGAVLVGAELRGADLTAVRYDESTVWPEGFDPPPSA